MTLKVLLVLAVWLAACSGGDDAPTAAPTPRPTTAAVGGTISIPSLEINAPLTPKALVEGVALPSPDGAKDVALYDFGRARGVSGPLGGAPGEGGNVVMSGRSISDVGCAPAEPPCSGVFGALSAIALGDRIDVNWRGGDYRYQVVSVCNVASARFGEGLYSRTAQEQLTLLTGAGALGPGGFTHVLVVIARRAPVTAAEPCPAGTNDGPPQ
jgi:sortase (surface protein transpeptidase)